MRQIAEDHIRFNSCQPRTKFRGCSEPELGMKSGKNFTLSIFFPDFNCLLSPFSCYWESFPRASLLLEQLQLFMLKLHDSVEFTGNCLQWLQVILYCSVHSYVQPSSPSMLYNASNIDLLACLVLLIVLCIYCIFCKADNIANKNGLADRKRKLLPQKPQHIFMDKRANVFSDVLQVSKETRKQKCDETLSKPFFFFWFYFKETTVIYI